jgi:hypothetical protein
MVVWTCEEKGIKPKKWKLQILPSRGNLIPEKLAYIPCGPAGSNQSQRKFQAFHNRWINHWCIIECIWLLDEFDKVRKKFAEFCSALAPWLSIFKDWCRSVKATPRCKNLFTHLFSIRLNVFASSRLDTKYFEWEVKTFVKVKTFHSHVTCSRDQIIHCYVTRAKKRL